MYTTEDYIFGWAVYLFGVVIMLVCGWIMTARFKSQEFKWLLRVAASVLFLVPWYVAPDSDYLAPAWIIAGFEGVFDGLDAFWRAGTPLLTAVILACVISLIYRLVVNRSNTSSE